MMSNKTDWEKAADAQGATASERALVRIARKAFLTLWSYVSRMVNLTTLAPDIVAAILDETLP